jgi:hypothetical protein
MFTKKHRVKTLAACMIVAALVLSGCRNPVGNDNRPAANGKTKLSLTVSKPARTLIPDGAGGTLLTLFQSYTVEFARGVSETGTPALPTTTNSTLQASYTATEIASVTIEGIEEGYWDIFVYGHNTTSPVGTTTAAAIGKVEDVQITLTGGEVLKDIEIMLLPFTTADGTTSIGNGKFTYDITLTGGVNASLTEGLLTVEALGSPASIGAATPALPYSIPAGELQPTTTKSWDLPAGMYRVTLTFTDNLGKVAGVTDIAYIYRNMETKLAFSCAATDFMNLITLSGTTMLSPPALAGTGVRPDAALDSALHFKLRAYYEDPVAPGTYHWMLQSSSTTLNYWNTADGTWSMQTPAFSEVGGMDVQFVLELERNNYLYYSKVVEESGVLDGDITGINLNFTEPLTSTDLVDNSGLITVDNGFLTHNMFLLALDRSGLLTMKPEPYSAGTPIILGLNPKVSVYYGSPLATGGTMAAVLPDHQLDSESDPGLAVFSRIVEAGTYIALVKQDLTATSVSPIGFTLTSSFKKATKVSGTITLKYNGATTFGSGTVDDAELHFYTSPTDRVMDFDGTTPLVAEVNPTSGAYTVFMPSLTPPTTATVTPKAILTLTFSDTTQELPMEERTLTSDATFSLGDAPTTTFNGTAHFEYNTISGAVTSDTATVDISFLNKVYILKGTGTPDEGISQANVFGSAAIEGGAYKWRHDKIDPYLTTPNNVYFFLVREDGTYRYYANGSATTYLDSSMKIYGTGTGAVAQPAAGVYTASIPLVLKTTPLTLPQGTLPADIVAPAAITYSQPLYASSENTGDLFLINTTVGTSNSRSLRLRVRRPSSADNPPEMVAKLYQVHTTATEVTLPIISDVGAAGRALSYYVTPISQATTPYIVLTRYDNNYYTTYDFEAEVVTTSVTLTVTYKPTVGATDVTTTGVPSGIVAMSQPMAIAFTGWEVELEGLSTSIFADITNWKWYVNGVLQAATGASFTTTPTSNAAFYTDGGINTVTVEVTTANGSHYGYPMRFNLQQ